MALLVHRRALEAVSALAPLAVEIRRRDRSLAEQLRRAASSIVLNIAEGEYSDPGTSRSRFHSAAGSANETRAALQVACAWGYIARDRAAEVDGRLEEIIRMLWPLTKGRR